MDKEQQLKDYYRDIMAKVMVYPHEPRYHIMFEWIMDIAGHIEPTTKLLDLGAGRCVYKPFFDRGKYFSADRFDATDGSGKLDVICDAQLLPFQEQSFDIVFYNAVLEHVPEPEATLKAIYSILKPNGHLYLNAPLVNFEHQQPYDFFRYTQFGLKHLLSKCNYKISYIRPSNGDMHTALYVLVNCLNQSGNLLDESARSYVQQAVNFFFRVANEFDTKIRPKPLIPIAYLVKAIK